MARVYIPRLQHAYAQPGLNAPPTSAVASAALGGAARGISQTLIENQIARDSLSDTADALDPMSPETANILRAQARNIPYFSVSSGSGGGAGGRGASGGRAPGLGGITNRAVDFGFDMAMETTQHTNATAIENLRTQNRLGIISAGDQVDAAATQRRLDADEIRNQWERENMGQSLQNQLDVIDAYGARDKERAAERERYLQLQASLFADSATPGGKIGTSNPIIIGSNSFSNFNAARNYLGEMTATEAAEVGKLMNMPPPPPNASDAKMRAYTMTVRQEAQKALDSYYIPQQAPAQALEVDAGANGPSLFPAGTQPDPRGTFKSMADRWSEMGKSSFFGNE